MRSSTLDIKETAISSMCSDILAAGMHVVCSILINCRVLFKLPEKRFWSWAPFQAQASSSHSVPTVMTLSPEGAYIS